MQQAEDNRQKILDAALVLISKNGFHGTPMSLVAKEAHVSVGNIYNYFESKDDLIDDLYKAVKIESGQEVLRNFDQNQSLENQIRQLVTNVFRYAVWHPQEMAFIKQYAHSPYYRLEIDAEIGKGSLPILELFEQAREEKLIKDFPFSVIGVLTIDVATGLAQQQASGQLKVNDSLVTQVIDAVWDAIRA